ncbi:MAG: GtrA family protein [Rhodospirillaceae bacterium]
MTIAGIRRLTESRLGRLTVQFGKFGLVGIVGLCVDIAVLYGLMSGLGVGPYLARIGSFLAAASATWALNRVFTFRGRHEGSMLRQWGRFIAANAFGGVINYAIYASLIAATDTVAHHPFLGVAAGSIAGMFFNFAASKKLVFRAV